LICTNGVDPPLGWTLKREIIILINAFKFVQMKITGPMESKLWG